MGFKLLRLMMLCFGVNFSFLQGSYAQEIAPGFTHQVWTVDEGLPINSLNDITVTDDGFVWISTHNGMVRFNGLTHSEGNLFQVYNKGNNSAFSSNSLNKILEISNFEFFVLGNTIGETQSVIRYRNREFENFVTSEITFPYDIAHLDKEGKMWAIKNGKVYSLSDSGWKDEFPSINIDINGYVEFQVISRNNIWVLSKETGELFHIENGNLKRVGKEQGFSSDDIGSFEVTKNGKVWVVTRNGIEVLENGKTSFIHKINPSISYNKSSLTEDPTMEGRIIYRTWEGSEMHQHIVTLTGIQNLDTVGLEGSNFPLITPNNQTNNGTGWLRVRNDLYFDGELVLNHQNPIRNSKIDNTGGIWFVTVGELHYIKKNSFDAFGKLSHDIENVYPIFEDHEGAIWAGVLEAKLVSMSSSKFEEFTDMEEAQSRRFFSFLEDEENNLWMGSSISLLKWDRKSIVEEVKPFDAIDLKFIRGLLQDRNGTIWVGSEREILSFSKEAGWKNHEIIDYDGRLDTRFVFEDLNGRIWFGSIGKGLLYVDIETEKIKEFEYNSLLTGQSIREMYQDSDGIYWIGLDGYGLIRMELNSDYSIEKITHYDQSNGLQGQVIHAILEDDFGKVWMSSNSGVFWVSKAELEHYAKGTTPRIYSTVFGKNDGLPGMEANGGTQSSGIKTKDGRFLFAMVAGIGIVYPDRVNEESKEVITRVDGLITSDSSYNSGKNLLKLTKTERDLQFTYAAFNFELYPKNIRYRYKLEGYDDEWIEVEDRKEAFYTNVSGGDYNFVVQAALFGYDWTDNQSTLAFTIKNYFYETIWFKLLFTTGLISILYFSFKWRIRSAEKRAIELTELVEEQTFRLKEQAVKLQEIDKAKSKFFANVSHEFRTPLTLIIGPLKDITKNTKTISKEVTESKAKLALRNSNRLLKLVNQILDISKVESGTMELKVSEVDLVQLIKSIIQAFGSLAEQRQVSVTQSYFEDNIPVFVDKDSIEKVIVNILSNAFKFTPVSGKISMIIKEEKDQIQIELKDSGRGVESNKLVHIFDRFYQTDESNTANQVGTGIGLALAKELIELHKGTIRAESKPGLGLNIIITLKKGHDHFDEHQFAEEGKEVANMYDNIAPIEEARVETQNDKEVGETTILIIDDNQEIRSYLNEHLSTAYRILEEENGLDGLKAVKSELPDIVICDVMMPKMDGYEFCKALKSDPETDFIPVTLLTAKAEQSDKLEGLGLGADDYIMKPFDIEEVKARTKNLIQSRKKLMNRFSKTEIKLELPIADLPNAEIAFTDEIRDFILDGMGDENFGVEDLAQELLMSRRTLHNRIKKITNKSASDLIREIRLERAHQLLSVKAGTISEIAYSVGFKSIAHFSRVFKEQYKVNPSEITLVKG